MRGSLSSFMAGFWRGPCSLSCLPFWFRLCSVHSRVQFLSMGSPSFLVRPGNCWRDDRACSTQLPETQYWVCIFCFISLIINNIIIISVISKVCLILNLSLSLFLFPFWRGCVNREYPPHSFLPPCSKWWHFQNKCSYFTEQHCINLSLLSLMSSLCTLICSCAYVDTLYKMPLLWAFWSASHQNQAMFPSAALIQDSQLSGGLTDPLASLLVTPEGSTD